MPSGKVTSDRLGSQVARLVLEPSEVRDILTAGIFAPKDLSEPLGLLDDALVKVVAAEAVEQQLRQAMKSGALAIGDGGPVLEAAVQAGVISAAEAEVVRAAEAARNQVIQVDDFPQKYGSIN